MQLFRNMRRLVVALSLSVATSASAMPWFSLRGDQAAVSAGAGVQGFVDAPLRNATRPVGSAWDLRFTFGMRARFAVELEYLGWYASVTATGPAPYLLGNSITSDLRLNFGPWQWQPFAFAGAGYDRVELHDRLANPDAAAPFRPVTDGLVIPLGLGFDTTFVRHLNFDLRVAYRVVVAPSLLTDAEARNDHWLIVTHVGYWF